MTFLDPPTIQAATGGTWLAPPSDRRSLAGVGIDTRADLADRAFVAIRGRRYDGHDYLAEAASAGARLLVVERKPDPLMIPADVAVLEVPSTRSALGAMARSWRESLAETIVIAVTGSVGKTTTKDLIHGVLARTLRGTAAPRSFNNEIGVPLTLLEARPSDAYVVVEIGMNAPGEIAHLASIAKPDVAVITTVGRAHLEGLRSIEQVAREKASILDALAPGGLAVIGADAAAMRPWHRRSGRTVLFGESPAAHVRLTARGIDDRGHWIEVNGVERFELGLPGRHNAINALAAVAVARHLDVPTASIGAALAESAAAPMRMSVHDVGEIRVYNDAYNANPDSVIASLETFQELAASRSRRVVVLGDMLELGPLAESLHVEVGRALAAQSLVIPVEQVVLIGDLAAAVATGLGPTFRGAVTKLPKMPSDAGAVAELIRPGDAVLLKGSRGAAVERVIELLERLRPEPRPAGQPTVAAT